MDQLQTGKDKIRKICDLLKNETLDPAKAEAQDILQKAEEKARLIIRDAEERAKTLQEEAQQKIQEEKKVFDSNLASACKLGLEALRQDIENKLFAGELESFVAKLTVDPKLQAEILRALVSAVEKEGTSADFSGYIGNHVPKEELLVALGQQVIAKLKEKDVLVGEFIGGIQLKLHDRKMILDISNEALKELIGRYIRKDFRKLLFAEG